MSSNVIDSSTKLEPVELKRPDYSYGFTDSPLVSGKNTIGVFLDTGFFSGATSILGEDSGYIQINDVSSMSGSLGRKNDGNKIITPYTGTYIIQGHIEIMPSGGVDPAIMGVVIEENTRQVQNHPIFKNYVYMIGGEMTIPFSTVANLEKGNFLRCYGYNGETTNNVFNLYLHCIRIS